VIKPSARFVVLNQRYGKKVLSNLSKAESFKPIDFGSETSATQLTDCPMRKDQDELVVIRMGSI